MFLCVLAKGSSRLEFFTLAVSIAALDVGQLEVHDLMHDNMHDSTGPDRVRRRVDNGIFLVIVDDTLLILESRIPLQIFRKVLLLAISSQLRAQLGLAEVSNLPVQLTRHLAALIQALQLGYLRIHAARMLEHFPDRELDFANYIIRRVSVL